MARASWGGPSTHVKGVDVMRVLAHPTRVRILGLLRREPMSAPELARELGIGKSSAQWHVNLLAKAGMAQPAGQRVRRGGVGLLFHVPDHLKMDWEAETPRKAKSGVYRAHLVELSTRLELALKETAPKAASNDRLTLREIKLRPADVFAAQETIRLCLERLEELHFEASRAESFLFTLSIALIQIPRSPGERP